MRRPSLALGLIMLYVLSLAVQSASACTIFTATQEETVLFGGNEDQRPNDAYLIVDTSGRFGVVYIGTSWGHWSMVEMTGINEQGLSFDCNWIPPEALNPHPERGDPGEWVVTHVLKECATVEEVLGTALAFDWGESIDYQVHFADATGDAAVIHPGTDGELTHTRKRDGDGHLVSTNFNLASLETGDYSCRRYDTASEMLSELEAGEALTVEFMASVLDATHQEGEVSTIYSTIYDLKERVAYLYYDHRFDEPVILDIAAELEKGDRQVNIDELLPAGLDSTKKTIVSRLLAQPLTCILALGTLFAVGYYVRARARDTESWVLGGRWLLIVVLIIAGISIWNSRATLFPDKFPVEYSNYGFTFRHPQDADFWEVGLDNENVFDYAGTIRPSEDRGMVGYNRDSQEVAITWSAMEHAPTLEEILKIHYKSVIVNSERRDREITITKGELETGETNGHTTALQFHTLEVMMPGSSEPLYAEGYIGGWYCQSTGRFYFVYVYQWNLGQPPDQTEEQALARLNTFLETLRCHG